jgi:hypothetical protein
MLTSNSFSALLSIAIGAALLAGAGRIVTAIVRDAEVVATESANIRDLLSAAFAMLGVFLGIEALREIGQMAFAIARPPEWGDPRWMTSLLQQHQQELVGAVIQLLFAVVLILNAAALAMLWARIHSMKAAHDDEPASPRS